jgi:superfamily II DNA or RNA helicase
MEYVGNDRQEGTRELQEIFKQLIEPKRTLGANPRVRLQELGVLARPILQTIPTSTKMRLPALPNSPETLSEEQLEQIDRVLATQTDNVARRLAVLKHILPIAREEVNSLLYFGPTVRDAECMAYLLRRERIPAAVVTGETREATRRQVIAEFKQKKIRVLCNCEVLTTGFDAPVVTHVVMARPTVSQVLYEQIVGRGLRGKEFGGTETCVILNCEDDIASGGLPLGYQAFRRVWTGEP